ncbi:MAG: hypothetical protein RQ966_02335 [Acetobacteraceae bacterium]|nr:hypothetical protein [Acetobacteraceae bacterium]
MAQVVLTPARPGTTRRVASSTWIGPSLVVIASTFNLLFCFLNTKGLHLGLQQVALAQIMIFGCGLFAVRRSVDQAYATGAAMLVLLVIGLKVFNRDVDLKILFDVGLIPVFMLLGRASSLKQADRVVTILIICVVGIGLFELLAPTIYERIFNIREYYVTKGALDADYNAGDEGGFLPNGQRVGDAGRNILPGLLGPHRVASIFLETVSMGNFAIICLIWLLASRPASTWRRMFLIGGAVAAIVLSDSRFGMGCSLLLLAVWGGGWHRSRAFTFLLPIGALVALCAYGLTQHVAPGRYPWILSDDLQGRLRFSGAMLDFWPVGSWFGLVASPTYTADTGYAYLLNQIGLPAAIILWGALVFSPTRSSKDRPMRGYIALYLATSLCVGASPFSIKTAALAWFLVGALQSSSAQTGPYGSRSEAAARLR